MKQSKILALTIIALLSTAPIACTPTSRYQDLMAAQKNRELTSDEKATLQLLEQFKGWGTKHWLLSSNSSSANLFSPHFDSGTRRSCGSIYIDEIEDLSYKPREQISEHTSLDTEFGSVVLSGLINDNQNSWKPWVTSSYILHKDERTGQIMPIRRENYGAAHDRFMPDVTIEKDHNESPLSSNTAIAQTASLIAAHAQTDGVNYERLAKSLEQLHTFNTLQAQIDKLSHLDEID
jgi:hypothetical protein